MPVTHVNTQQANVTGITALVITKPTGLVNGDVIIGYLCHADDSPAVTLDTLPAGWAIEGGKQGSNGAVSPPRLWQVYKVITNAAGEPSSYSFDWNQTGGRGGGLIALRGVNTADIFGATGSNTSGNTTSINSPTVLNGADDAWLFRVAIGDDDDAGWTVPGGHTDRVSQQNSDGGNGFHMSVADLNTDQPSGLTGTETWTQTSEECDAFTFIINAIIGTAPIISNMDDEDFVDGETGVTITGINFETPQLTGFVEISDNIVYASGTKVAQIIESWGASSIDIEIVLGALTPGTLYAWVTNDTGERNISPQTIAVHRKAAFQMSASPNVVDGEATTSQLTGGSGSFVAGVFEEVTAASASVDIPNDGKTEIEWSVIRTPDVIQGVRYIWEVTLADGSPLDSYTQRPEWLYESSGTPVDLTGFTGIYDWSGLSGSIVIGDNSTPVNLTGLFSQVNWAGEVGSVITGVTLTGQASQVNWAGSVGSIVIGDNSTPVDLTGFTSSIDWAGEVGSILIGVVIPVDLTGETSLYDWTGEAGSVVNGIDLTGFTSQVNWSGRVGNVNIGDNTQAVNLSGEVGLYNVPGFAGMINIGAGTFPINLTGGTGIYNWAGSVGSLLLGKNIVGEQSTYEITGLQGNADIGVVLSGETGQYDWIGQVGLTNIGQVTLTPVIVTGLTSDYEVSGLVGTINIGLTLEGVEGIYEWSGEIGQLQLGATYPGNFAQYEVIGLAGRLVVGLFWNEQEFAANSFADESKNTDIWVDQTASSDDWVDQDVEDININRLND